jgi:alpha-glucosidase
MDDYKDFTISPRDEWKTLADLVNTTIHANDIKFIPIVDAGIAQRDGGNYSVYNSGKDRGVFINAYKGTDTLLTGQVWPNDAVFPDFFRDATKEWWGEMLSDFYE